MKHLHPQPARLMAAEYLCHVARMSTSEADLRAVIGHVMTAPENMPSSLDHAMRLAGKAQKLRILAAIDIIAKPAP